jgi:hypothetical protein
MIRVNLLDAAMQKCHKTQMTKLQQLIGELISILRMDDASGRPTVPMISTASRVLHRLPEDLINQITIDWYTSSVDLIWDKNDALRYFECKDDGTILFVNTDEEGVHMRKWSGDLDEFFSHHSYMIHE